MQNSSFEKSSNWKWAKGRWHGWCGQVKIMPLMDRAATWSGLRETIIHFLTAGGQKGRILWSYIMWGFGSKSAPSLTKKNHKSFLYIFKIWRLKFIFAHTVANPTKKLSNITWRGQLQIEIKMVENYSWDQQNLLGKKIVVTLKWISWYLVICMFLKLWKPQSHYSIYYGVFPKEHSRGKIPFNCSGFLSRVSKTQQANW